MEKVKEILAKIEELDDRQFLILCLAINAVGSLCSCLSWGILTEIFLLLGIGSIVYAWLGGKGNITKTAVIAVLIWLVPSIVVKGIMGTLLFILYICLDIVVVVAIIWAVDKWLTPSTYLDWKTGEAYEEKDGMLVGIDDSNHGRKIGPVSMIYVGPAVMTVNGKEMKGAKYTTVYGDFFKERGFLDFGPNQLS